MYTIFLKNIELFGYHGLYQEEAIVGNNFVINVEIDINKDAITQLQDSVNYGEAFLIVKTVFAEKEALLEVICNKCIAALENLTNHIARIAVSIQKKQPPISNGFVGAVIVKKEKFY
jgi:7,8-dihydroneopterin aldolase/epimerase/oxygenase